jgi:flagellar secretion chaperone FliS
VTLRFGRPNPGDASRQYRALALSSRLEAASPHQLVGILYEELGKALDVLLAVEDRGGTLRDDPHADRARAILLALTAGLDLDRGGPLAVTLAIVYRAMTKTFGMAIVEADRAALAELRSGVAALAESWQKIVN